MPRICFYISMWIPPVDKIFAIAWCIFEVALRSLSISSTNSSIPRLTKMLFITSTIDASSIRSSTYILAMSENDNAKSMSDSWIILSIVFEIRNFFMFVSLLQNGSAVKILLIIIREFMKFTIFLSFLSIIFTPFHYISSIDTSLWYP